MSKRYSPRAWENPEVDQWDNYDYRYDNRCFPFGALAIGTIGAIGIAAGCRPRRFGYPYAYYPYPPAYGYYPYPPAYGYYPYPPGYGYYPYV